ncbi:MAG: hypothetical protein COA44_10890 [Arcobacter sp.]|nr:MAG: hypothetical protein COA44_10890 [Arcobacter sp.]
MNDEIIEFLDREQLTLAPKLKRLYAFMIDELILSVIWLSIMWDKFSGIETTEAQIELVNSFLIEFMLLKLIYHTFFLMQYAASPGKMIMKIRVLELRSASFPSFFTALNRAFFRGLSEVLFYAGFIWGLLDPASQTWHDKTARTIVIDV